MPFKPSLVVRSAVGLNDSAGDDGLYEHLVDSLFSSASSAQSANVMGMAATITAYELTGSRWFLICAAVVFCVSLGRTALHRRYGRERGKIASRLDYERYDLLFSIYASLISLAVGMTAYQLIQFPPETGSHAIASGVGMSYAMGFVARNAGRPKLVIFQTLATIVPMIVAFAGIPGVYAVVAIILLVGAFVAATSVTLSLNSNIRAVYTANSQTRRLALYDKLTGLANRYTFMDRISAAMSSSPGRFAILYLDLDRFKDINDSLGHDAGDAVIAEIALRLRRAAKPDDLIARFGGDEFLLKIGFDEDAELETVIDESLARIAAPIVFDGNLLYVTASIGVALSDGANTPEALIKNADIALYEAKAKGGKTHVVFHEDMARKQREIRELTAEVRAAVANREFFLNYQPIYDLASRDIVCVEALLRWRHPVRGLVSPDIFIPIAEQTSAIVELGEQVIAQACLMARGLPERVAVAINISPVQMRQPERLVRALRRSLEDTGLQPGRVHLEITESMLLGDIDAIKAVMSEIVGIGVKFALDDFGTGYSSLSYIQDFPFSKIKIDKSFTGKLSDCGASYSIVKAVAQIARDLQLEVVVEGIESEQQEVVIRSLGPSQGQGFLFSKPLSSADLSALFREPAQAGRTAA